MFEKRNSYFNRKKTLLLKLNFQKVKIISLRQILQKSLPKILFNSLINEGGSGIVISLRRISEIRVFIVNLMNKY